MRYLRMAMALLLSGLACMDDPPTVSEWPHIPGPSSMSGVAEGVAWNAVQVKAKRQQGFIGIEGRTWISQEDQLVITLLIQAEVGVTQILESSPAISATVVSVPMYDVGFAWIAKRATGSGTVTITTLTATGATGTFSFTGRAEANAAVPQDFRVTNGSFSVSF
jgi:hypothetical protein